LRAWGLLIENPNPVSELTLTLTGPQIHRELLRDMVRDRLYEKIFRDPQSLFDIEFASLRTGCNQGQVLHVRLELWSDQVPLFQLPWELLSGDPRLNGEIAISRYIRYTRRVHRITPAAHLRLLVVQSEPTGLAFRRKPQPNASLRGRPSRERWVRRSKGRYHHDMRARVFVDLEEFCRAYSRRRVGWGRAPGRPPAAHAGAVA